MVSAAEDPLTFDELMATPINFSKFVMNHLKIDKLSKAHLVGPNNPEGDRCPYELRKPLPLKGHPGRLTVPFDYFFNNDLEYLKASDPEKKYTMSIMKTKAARYELVGIEDMIPNLWSVTKVGYNKDVERGIKHWGPKRQLFYRSQINKFSKHDVYLTRKILSVVSMKINKLLGYGHLEEIAVTRANHQKYKFKEGNFVNLHLNDIEDMLLLVAQHKLFNLKGSDIVDLAVALCMFTRGLIIERRVEDVQLELYTPSFNPPGAVYEELNKQKRVIQADELYKFSNGTLKLVHDELYHRVLKFCLGYNKEMSRRNGQLQTREGQSSWSNSLTSRCDQNRRDLPRDIPLDTIEVLRYDTKGVKWEKRIMPTKTELLLEQTQQGASDEVLIVIMDPVMQCTTLPSHLRFLALGWLLEEIHATWAHLEKKRTRLRTYTKSLEDLCKQWLETAS
ncbi:hypothetical protein Tco_0677922 [Tanacetum coccineum]|uniref:Uncharacterized protein n=1 Tax=Tanacetum coccineum TaxID=301880 RepID=A0ABQ4XDM7_9ASTR